MFLGVLQGTRLARYVWHHQCLGHPMAIHLRRGILYLRSACLLKNACRGLQWPASCEIIPWKGVALYIRNTVSFKLRDDLPNKSLELICIEIEPPNASPFIIVAWYRPPGVPVSCFESLEENLRFLDRENEEIIILGDTNCDFSLPRPSNANHSSHLQEIYDLFGLRQLIEEPTRVTLHSSSLIDHIATSEYRNISESGVIKTSLSDHFLIYCIRKFRGGVKRQHKYITSGQLKNFDKTAFLSDLSQVNWEEIIANASNSDDAVRSWTTIFSPILDKHAPNLTR